MARAVPRAGGVKQAMLVREDLSIDQMLFTATYYRPDLEAIRTLVAAADADNGATIWGGLGPQVLASRTFAPPPPASALSDTEYRQQIYMASAGFNWSLATFGRIRTAAANTRIAGLNAERQLDLVQAAVVTAHQTSLTAKKAIPIAQEEVTSAEEALRLTQKNLEPGTGLTIDVLVAQDAADQARLRYATAVIRYNQAETNLLAVLGLIDQISVAARAP
jgi:outer membrane protein TolC